MQMINEDNVICFFYYVCPRTDKITSIACTDTLDMILAKEVLSLFGVEYTIEPSILRKDLINYDVQGRR